MRILLVGITSLFIASAAFGQGTIDFNNVSSKLSSPPDRLVRNTNSITPFGTNNAPVVNTGTTSYRAQLYYATNGTVEGSLVAVTSAPAVFRLSTTANPGTWNGGVRTLDGFTTNNVVTVQVRVWDNQFASSYEAAVALGTLYAGQLGKSAPFTYTVPDAGTATPSAFFMSLYQGFPLYAPAQIGPATINTNPVSLVRTVGGSATFTVYAAGEPTLNYQWYKSPASPVGGNSSALNLSNLQLADAGGYYCVVMNGSGSATSLVASLTVNCPTITLSSSTLSNGTSGLSYSATISAGGGVPAYSFAVTSGSLPSGLSLSSGGALSGTATAAGIYNFTVTATDSGGSLCTGSSNYSITIDCPTITVGPATLPNATAAVAYNQTNTASGGSAPYTFAVTNCAPGTNTSLPTGLTLNETNGVISGTPTVTGCFDFQIVATDANGCTGSQCYTVCVSCATITINPASLPPGVVASNYSATISASGGIAPYTFTNIVGSLPAGLSLASNGNITGSPTGGSATFTVQSTDANGCTGTKVYTISVGVLGVIPGLTVNTPKDKTDVTSATITVEGKVNANPNGLAQILVHGGSGYTTATIKSNTPVAIVFTNTGVALQTGPNDVYAEGFDGAGTFGFSKTNHVFLKVPSTLTLLFDSGKGTVVGNPLTTPSGVETPANLATLSVKRAYTLNITPNIGTCVFSNVIKVVNGVSNIIYTADPSVAAQKGAKGVPFTMETNMTLIVNFATNRFVGAAGVYYGLFSQTGSAHESSGWFQIKTLSTLKFSGKMEIQGETVGFAGAFNLAGVGTLKPGKIIGRKGLTNDNFNIVLQLNLAGAGSISGTVQAPSWSGPATLDGDKGTLTPSAAITAPFSMVIKGNTNAATQPAGDGFVLAAVDPVKALMKTSIAYAGDFQKAKPVVTGVSETGDWPFYQVLYQTTRVGVSADAPGAVLKTYLGSVIGWLNVSNGIITGDLVWNRASMASSGNTNTMYSGGFSNTHSSTDGTLLSSAFSGPGVPATGTVTIKDGNLSSPIVLPYTTVAGKIVVAGFKTNGVKVTVLPLTGLVKGQYGLVATKSFGAFIQSSGLAYGVFPGTTQSGSLRLTP